MEKKIQTYIIKQAKPFMKIKKTVLNYEKQKQIHKKKRFTTFANCDVSYI